MATTMGILFVIAFALRFSLFLLLPDFDVPVRGEMERVAASWAATGQLADPYSTPTGPTAHVAPVYPVLLGLFYRVFGTGAEGHLAQAAFSCALSAVRCSLLVLLAMLLGLGFRVGVIAGVLGTGYITAFNTELRGSWEAPLAGLFLMALTAIAAGFSRAPAFRLKDAIPFGCMVGVGVLLSPALAPPTAAFLLCSLRWGVRQWSRYLLWLAVLGSSAFLIVLPWLVRNQHLLGSPVIRSNFGLELSLAYNDRQDATALDPGITDTHPLINRAVSQQVAEVGEISFNHERKEQAMNWIRRHPAAALRLFGEHVFYFWFPPAENVVMRLVLSVVAITALSGFRLLCSENHLAATLVGVLWVSFPLIYYVTYWSSRYRYPIEWTLLLCAAVALDWGWRRIQDGPQVAH